MNKTRTNTESLSFLLSIVFQNNPVCFYLFFYPFPDTMIIDTAQAVFRIIFTQTIDKVDKFILRGVGYCRTKSRTVGTYQAIAEMNKIYVLHFPHTSSSCRNLSIRPIHSQVFGNSE